MKVVLLRFTPEPEKTVAAAARVCYGSMSIEEIFESTGKDHIEKRINDCLERGHLSILEHASFTFGVEGISRVTSHQLVRHRLASYSQQSQRYVKARPDAGFVVPPAIARDTELRARFLDLCSQALDFYSLCLQRKIAVEDARFILPSAVKTQIVLTMNARELLHFFNLRCCIRSQWEIRAMAWRMLRLARAAAPMIFGDAGPPCLSRECPEKEDRCFKKMVRLRRARREPERHGGTAGRM